MNLLTLTPNRCCSTLNMEQATVNTTINNSIILYICKILLEITKKHNEKYLMERNIVSLCFYLQPSDLNASNLFPQAKNTIK